MPAPALLSEPDKVRELREHPEQLTSESRVSCTKLRPTSFTVPDTLIVGAPEVYQMLQLKSVFEFTGVQVLPPQTVPEPPVWTTLPELQV
jgi:hypothetical protein